MGSVTSSIVPFGTSSLAGPHLKPPPPPKFYPDFVSSPVEELHWDFMRAVCILLLQNGLFFAKRRAAPPLRFKKPEALLRLIDTELRSSSTSQFQLLGLLRQVLFYSPQFCHPYYMYQLLAGICPYSMIGDWVASAIPSTMLAYREAPVYYLMEEELTHQFQLLSGYTEDSFDLIFPPGAALGNCLAIVMARQQRHPDSKYRGTFSLPPMVIFVSEDAHGSYLKGAIYTGIGLDNVISIKTDSRGKMSIPHLLKAINSSIEEGKTPLMIGATSGSNWCGAFDPLEDLARICRQYKMWLHSDGALGGGIIFSEEARRKYLPDLAECDSFVANFHKIGSANQTSTILMTKHKTIFREAFGLECTIADTTSVEGGNRIEEFFRSEMDTYEKYIEHTRRPDAVKLFFMWKAKGLEGLGANVDDAYDRATFFLEELKRRQREDGKFVPLMEELECPVVPFYFIPVYLHGADRSSEGFKERLNVHTSFLLGELIRNGIMVITVQSLRDSPLFFKVVLHNSAVTKEDVVYLLDQIDNYGTYLRVPQEVPIDIPERDPDQLPRV